MIALHEQLSRFGDVPLCGKHKNNNTQSEYIRFVSVVFMSCLRQYAALALSLFLDFGRKHHVHLLAVEFRHHLHLGELFEVRGKAQQQDFALLLEDERPRKKT